MSALLTAISTNFRGDTHVIRRIRRWSRYRRDLLSMICDIDRILSREHATGTLILHYGRGHMAECEFHEEAPLREPSLNY
jgi:hypothetical protein